MTCTSHTPDPTGAAPERAEHVTAEVLSWYADHQRDLPWRSADRTPWGVLVSEIMLAQTPVDRVVPYWTTWLARWPAPERLAEATPADAVRAWGRLGYPRRALRLHGAAVACVERFEGEVPSSYQDLRTLPGVGDYTAAAVVAFGFGGRAVVLDTNVRRVLARAFGARALPGPSVTVVERALAAAVLPVDPPAAATWSVAVMELGALVCTARSPHCQACPIAPHCRWLGAGRPPPQGKTRPAQRFTGSDRQVRGLLLALLRENDTAVPVARLDTVWPDPVQRARALAALVADGLAESLPEGTYQLPQRGSRHMVSTVGPLRGSANLPTRVKPTDS